MGADICDIKSGAFLMIVLIMGLNVDVLYCSMVNRASSVCRSIYVLDREWISQDSQSQGVVHGKDMIDDHSFCSTVKKSTGTDFLPIRETLRVIEGDCIFCIVHLGIGSESRVSNRATFCMQRAVQARQSEVMVWHLNDLEIQIGKVIVDWSDLMVELGYSGVFQDRWEGLVSIVFWLNCTDSRYIWAIWVIVEALWLFGAGFVPMALSATIHAALFSFFFFFFHYGKFLELFIMWSVVLRRKAGQSNI